MPPTHTMGGRASTATGPRDPALAPARITAAVPATGSAAHGAGNGVAASSRSTAATTAARPPQPTGTASARGSTAPRRSSAATRPPAASSHARAGRPKNAQGWELTVSTAHATNDTTTTAPTSAVRTRWERRTAKNPTSSSGHRR
ncbi:Uncharacterised protein [Mycobacteroides abscessus]|nr:Uncharacterised protein [Mycobacteroides abscessus]